MESAVLKEKTKNDQTKGLPTDVALQAIVRHSSCKGWATRKKKEKEKRKKKKKKKKNEMSSLIAIDNFTTREKKKNKRQTKNKELTDHKEGW